jgi:ABC-type transporter Mla subunit MlaD
MVAIASVLIAGGLAAAGSAIGQGSGPYEVRGYFDNAAFLVTGEDVRIAGAKVGVVSEVDVSREGEPVTGAGEAVPGNAVVVMRINDEDFQDFREDASCLIRPQSLLGEKFVDCQPTQPRAPGSAAPPELAEIPDGQPGAGQLFLPLENNGKAVDLDLVVNIFREPYADRFRLILNDLGAGLAARGDELAEIVERSSPALRETDRVLSILAEQNRALVQLARDADTVLEPLARERRSVRGFIESGNETLQAAAERRAELSAGLERLPPALRELRPTVSQLKRLAVEATPVATDLRTAASPLTEAVELLGPFTTQANTAVKSLANELEDAAPDLIASDPVILQLRDLANETEGGAKALKKLLGSLRETGGYDEVANFIFNTSGGFNGFDSFGHFLRTTLLVTNCVKYQVSPQTGCVANWQAADASTAGRGTPTVAGLTRLLELSLEAERGDKDSGGSGGAAEVQVVPEAPAATPTPELIEPAPAPEALAPLDPGTGADEGLGGTVPTADGGTEPAQRRGQRLLGDARMLMEFLMGDGR